MGPLEKLANLLTNTCLVSYVDAQIGDDEALEEEGVRDDTIIVVWEITVGMGEMGSESNQL